VNKIGDYEVTCNQLCGLGHYRMHAVLHVLSQADFAKWEAKEEAQNAQ
jgi:cytochrome c oxidase subunit II